jgi:hypothetical protein
MSTGYLNEVGEIIDDRPGSWITSKRKINFATNTIDEPLQGDLVIVILSK